MYLFLTRTNSLALKNVTTFSCLTFSCPSDIILLDSAACVVEALPATPLAHLVSSNHKRHFSWHVLHQEPESVFSAQELSQSTRGACWAARRSTLRKCREWQSVAKWPSTPSSAGMILRHLSHNHWESLVSLSTFPQC